MITARCIDEIDDPRSTINRIFSLEALVLVIFSSVISGYAQWKKWSILWS